MDNKTILDFLKQLAANNRREWYHDHKAPYQQALELFKAEVSLLIEKIGAFDATVKYLTPEACIFRLPRDIRFSPDKTPFKTHFGAYIAPNGGRKSIYAGYYLHIEPDNSLLSGGLYCPEKEVLKYVRHAIDANCEELQEITRQKDFVDYFGEIESAEALKRVPAGFSPDSPAAEWLKYKHFCVSHPITESFLLQPDFVSHAARIFEAMLPFNRFFNDIINDNV
jgi:uncharacterized protein (TIGR02453 family)